MKAKGILLASVAGSVVAPAVATAADMPVKAAPTATAAPAVAVAPSWAGLYLGVHAGVAWNKAKADQPGSYYGAIHLKDTKAGFIGGGLIGYNLQSGSLVYGVEADISGLSAKAKDTDKIFDGSFLVASNTLESEISWMATLRGRLGLATGNLLTFVTGGVAWADIDNKWTFHSTGVFDGTTTWSDKRVRTAPVLGGGFEYMFSPNWTGRVEGLWANFGKDTVTRGKGDAIGTGRKATTFKNEVVVVRGALNYKF